MAYFFPSVLVVLLAVNAAYSLKCYDCNSVEDKYCESAPSKLKECPTAARLFDMQCFKIIVERERDTLAVIRGCMSTTLLGCDYMASIIRKATAEKFNTTDISRNINCNTCKTDKCNSSQMISGVAITSFILAAVIFAF